MTYLLQKYWNKSTGRLHAFHPALLKTLKKKPPAERYTTVINKMFTDHDTFHIK